MASKQFGKKPAFAGSFLEANTKTTDGPRDSRRVAAQSLELAARLLR